MSKIENIKIKKLIHTIGLKYNLSDSIIKEMVESPYKFIEEIYKKLDLNDIRDEEELKKLKNVFMIRGIGKLFVSYPLIKRRNKQRENIINLNNKKNGRSK